MILLFPGLGSAFPISVLVEGNRGIRGLGRAGASDAPCSRRRRRVVR